MIIVTKQDTALLVSYKKKTPFCFSLMYLCFKAGKPISSASIHVPK